MKLIVGLGNPGKEYNFTRHNFGFLALDFYLKTHFPSQKATSVTIIDNIIFAKPQTFYNNIGQEIARLLRYYKINPKNDLLLICDDFSLPFGTIRLREQGSAGGNNGLKSTIAHLKTTDFPRLRLGTDNPARKILGDTDFVLGKFTPKEREKLPEVLRSISQKIDNFL